MESAQVIKLVMVGGGAVGKSCITIQHVKGNFIKEYDPTIEESYRKQTLVDDQVSMLEIVDTAGQEEFAGLREQWIRYGEGFFIVFSITSRTSFTKELEVIFRDMDRVREEAQRPPTILFGNKSDLERQRQVTTEEARDFAQRRDITYFEGSALANINIEPAFAHLIRLVRAGRIGHGAHSDAPGDTVSPLMAAKKAAGHDRQRRRGICVLL